MYISTHALFLCSKTLCIGRSKRRCALAKADCASAYNHGRLHRGSHIAFFIFFRPWLGKADMQELTIAPRSFPAMFLECSVSLPCL